MIHITSHYSFKEYTVFNYCETLLGGFAVQMRFLSVSFSCSSSFGVFILSRFVFCFTLVFPRLIGSQQKLIWSTAQEMNEDEHRIISNLSQSFSFLDQFWSVLNKCNKLRLSHKRTIIRPRLFKVHISVNIVYVIPRGIRYRNGLISVHDKDHYKHDISSFHA